MASVVQGVIRGRTIELVDDPGIGDGRGVEVTIRTRPDPDAERAAILRTSGSMADDLEFEGIMAQIERERHAESSRDAAG